MMYKVEETHPKESLKSKHSPFSKEIYRIMIRYLTFKIALHNRHSNFYALVTPQQSSCSSHPTKGTENVGEKNAKAKEKSRSRS